MGMNQSGGHIGRMRTDATVCKQIQMLRKGSSTIIDSFYTYTGGEESVCVKFILVYLHELFQVNLNTK